MEFFSVAKAKCCGNRHEKRPHFRLVIKLERFLSFAHLFFQEPVAVISIVKSQATRYLEFNDEFLGILLESTNNSLYLLPSLDVKKGKCQRELHSKSEDDTLRI